MAIFEADDLIYNRFDLIYQDGNVEKFQYKMEDEIFEIYAHYKGNRASLNVWGKTFPQEVYNQVIYDVFEKHLKIEFLDIKNSGNNFGNLLEVREDIRVQLPEKEEQLLGRIRGKNRTSIRKKKKLLKAQYGDLKLEIFHDEVSTEAVEQYFLWKKKSHGTDYHMEPKEYLKKYYVTDTLLLKAGEINASILFFCQVGKIAYLENLAYNFELAKFSPGFLIYEMTLEELIKRKCSYFYLGGGHYGYKMRFGAEKNIVYAGTIHRQDVANRQKEDL